MSCNRELYARKKEYEVIIYYALNFFENRTFFVVKFSPLCDAKLKKLYVT